MTSQPLDTFAEPQVSAPQASFLFIDQPWVDQALCAQTDPEAFFPEKGGTAREAKSVCARCFVQAECLDWALTTNEHFGVWGGLSERERRALGADSTCPTCDKSFATILGRDRHLAGRHNPANPHVCPRCGQSFTCPAHLNRHTATHRTTNTEGTAS